MKIQESAENYLEAVLVLRRQGGEIRAVDVAGYLGFARPTVSVMLHGLEDGGYLRIAENNHITLTKEGEEIARHIYERHVVIAELLQRLGVSEETACADSCRIEHDLSPESFACIRAFYDKLNQR
ncbi:MAG: metal-dependent transcriptional regulator [Oscillospiraceae bacterium]|nr:metal-dependent transcriptional regulator [Oscillospiraceae bacterium]